MGKRVGTKKTNNLSERPHARLASRRRFLVGMRPGGNEQPGWEFRFQAVKADEATAPLESGTPNLKGSAGSGIIRFTSDSAHD